MPKFCNASALCVGFLRALRFTRFISYGLARGGYWLTARDLLYESHVRLRSSNLSSTLFNSASPLPTSIRRTDGRTDGRSFNAYKKHRRKKKERKTKKKKKKNIRMIECPYYKVLNDVRTCECDTVFVDCAFFTAQNYPLFFSLAAAEN